jgi:hypothetical protein
VFAVHIAVAPPLIQTHSQVQGSLQDTELAIPFSHKLFVGETCECIASQHFQSNNQPVF